ncbi:MAG: hypothetical protein UW10_C0024G0001, partial [Candidatus Magasanikbacteria bacterium GW2011_GWA2_43_9]
MKRVFRICWRVVFFLFSLIVLAFFVYGYTWYQESREVREEHARQQAAIDAVLTDRQKKDFQLDGDPFGEDGVARVLLIGL